MYYPMHPAAPPPFPTTQFNQEVIHKNKVGQRETTLENVA